MDVIGAYPMPFGWSNRPQGLPASGGIDTFLEILRVEGQKETRSQASSEQQRDAVDVQKVLEGNGEAYRRLVENHQQRVGKMMWRFSRDPAIHKELVQDVFVEAYLSLNTYRGTAPFGHWLARIATRVGYRYWKRQAQEARLQTISLEECRDLPAPLSENPEPSRAAELLHDVLAMLPPRDRLVLTLRYFEDLDIEETAQRTGWSRAMVKVQTWRAKKKLKRILEDLGFEVSE